MLSLSRNKYLPLLLLILLSIPSVLPLLGSGFFLTDDGNWMVIRFSAFYQALADGQFPVRWLTRLNHSYGYPVSNFLYPGFMYLAVPFKLLGFSFLDSVKLVIILSMLGSSMFCYLWLRRRFSDFAAFVGALVYLYLPYHIYDLYQRGSVGELLALSVFPFILWQIERRSFVFTSLGIALLILAHNTLAVLFLPLIFLYMFFQEDFRKKITWYLLPLVLGLGMAAFFWIPALLDLKETVFFNTVISEWSSYFVDISLVGFTAILAMFMALFTWARNRKESNRRFFLFFFISTVLAVFLSSRASQVLWQILPVSFIQFPFRFLSVAIVGVAFLVSYSINGVAEYKRKILLGVVFLILLLPSFVRIIGIEKSGYTDDFFATNEDTTTVKNEYMPVYVSEIPTARPASFLTINDENTLIVQRPTTDISFSLSPTENSRLVYKQFYFPGWNLYVNGAKKDIQVTKQGEIGFFLEPGQYNVQIKFEETAQRLFADSISIISILLAISIPFFLQRKGYTKDAKIF